MTDYQVVDGVVNLEDSHLDKIPDSIYSDASTTQLLLSENNITHISPKINQMINLTKLDLSNNKLDYIPPIFNLVNLNYLNISDNNLKEFPEGFGGLENLLNLFISGNQFTELPLEASQLMKLEGFYASRNPITSISSDIANMESLKNLYLSHTSLEFLPEEINFLENLQDLNVSYSKLEDIDLRLDGLRSLVKLNVEVNEITRIPLEIGNLSNLEYIDFSHNLIESIPRELTKLKKLKAVYVDKNPIESIPEDLFKKLKDVLEMDETVKIISSRPAGYPNFLYFGEVGERLLAYHEQTMEYVEKHKSHATDIPFLDFSNLSDRHIQKQVQRLQIPPKYGTNWVVVAFFYWAEKFDDLVPESFPIHPPSTYKYKILPDEEADLDEENETLEFLAYRINPIAEQKPLWRSGGYTSLETLIRNLFDHKEIKWILSIVSGFGIPSADMKFPRKHEELSDEEMIDFLSAAYFFEKDIVFCNDLRKVVAYQKIYSILLTERTTVPLSLRVANVHLGYDVKVPLENPSRVDIVYNRKEIGDILPLLEAFNFYDPSKNERISLTAREVPKLIMPHLFLMYLRDRYFSLVLFTKQFTLEEQIEKIGAKLDRLVYEDSLIYYLPQIAYQLKGTEKPPIENLNPKNYGEFLPYSDRSIERWLNPLNVPIYNREVSRPEYLRNLSELATKPRWWWSMPSEGCKNEDNTNLISGDVRGEDPDDPVVSYGTVLHYRCYNLTELTYSFRENTETGAFTWTVPDEPRRQFPRESIKQLKELLKEKNKANVVWQPYNDIISKLLEKIKQGEKFFKDANAVVATWKKTYLAYNEEDRVNFEKFILWLFILSMDLRFWKGPGHDWPYKYLEDETQRQEAGGYCTSAEREYQTNVAAEILSQLNKHPHIYDFAKTLPLMDYSLNEKKFSVGQRKILDLFDLALRRNFCLTHLSDLYLNTAMFWIDQIFGWDEEEFNKMLRWYVKNPNQQGFDRTKISGKTGHVDPIFESQTNDLQDKLHNTVQLFQMTNIIYEKGWNEVILEELAGKAIYEEELGIGE
jgi:Leucine-rich repeat (LRR) protein